MDARPPKPPGVLVDHVTHHSVDLNWEPHLEQLIGAMNPEDGRIRAEVQRSRRQNIWEPVYKGFGVSCECGDLEPDTEFTVRLRFGNGHGWGAWSDPVAAKTSGQPFSGQDLHRQIRRRDLDGLVRVLNTGEANPNAPDERGFTPMTVAALEGLTDFCAALLEHKADVDWSGDNGKTCLMLVAYKGKPGALRWLLEAAGASPRPRDRNGLTALHYAVDGEQLENVRILLDAGADPGARDAAGCSPMVRCAQHRNNGNAAIAVELLARGAPVDDADDAGQTALFHCALNRHEKMAAVLLGRGADPAAKNTKGVSPLKVTEGQAPEKKAMRELLMEHRQQRAA